MQFFTLLFSSESRQAWVYRCADRDRKRGFGGGTAIRAVSPARPFVSEPYHSHLAIYTA